MFFSCHAVLKRKKRNRPWTTCFIALYFFLLNFIFPFWGWGGGTGRQTLARLTENKKYPFFLHCVKKQQSGCQTLATRGKQTPRMGWHLRLFNSVTAEIGVRKQVSVKTHVLVSAVGEESDCGRWHRRWWIMSFKGYMSYSEKVKSKVPQMTCSIT